MLKTFKLKNGIKVATYSLPSLKSVHIRMSTKGGSLVQDFQKSGVAHLMEHMLVQGIPSLPTVEDFVGFIEGLAGSYGAYTQSSLIGFDLTVPASHLEDAIKISSEVFFEPLFLDSALEKERRVVVDEIKQRMDSKWFKIAEFFNEVRFCKDHPLTINVGGDINSVQKLTREDLVNFWSQYFLPKNTYLVVVGNFSRTKLKALLEKHFGEYMSEGKFTGYPKMSATDFSSKKVAIRHDPTLQTNYLNLSFPSPCLFDTFDTRIKQSLALMVLGRLRNSRLFKLLRYQEGLVYDVSVGSYTLPGIGYIDITSEVAEEKLEQVVTLITREVCAFAKNGPTKDELEFAKNFLTNQWLMTFDHPSSIANWIEGELMWEGKISLPEELAAAIKDLDVDSLVEVMQNCWDFSKLNLVIQGPIENTDANIKKYTKILEELSWLMEEEKSVHSPVKSVKQSSNRSKTK